MKYFTFLILFLAVCNFATAQKVNFQELDYIHGKYIQRNTIGTFTGKAIDKHYNGKKKLEINIKDGQLNGYSREWAFNGQKIFEAEYNANVAVGTETRWYDNGKKKQEVHFVNGQPEGIATEWYANGQKMSEGEIKNGLETGTHTWYYKEGVKEQEVSYQMGKVEGAVKKWHPNKQQQLESAFKNGVKNGITNEWFMNGQLNSEVNYVNDLEDGKATIYSKKGILLEEKTYNKGQLMEDKNYRSGNIRTKQGYVQVFNYENDFYVVTVNSNKVYFREDADITFAVEGKLLQMFDQAKAQYFPKKDATKSVKDLLKEYVELESKIIEEATGSAIEVTSEFAKNKNGLEYVKWNFVSPSSKEKVQKPRTVQEEQYYSFILGDRILSLYSVVTNDDNTKEISNLLKRISDQVKTHNSRIDLNTIIR